MTPGRAAVGDAQQQGVPSTGCWGAVQQGPLCPVCISLSKQALEEQEAVGFVPIKKILSAQQLKGWGRQSALQAAPGMGCFVCLAELWSVWLLVSRDVSSSLSWGCAGRLGCSDSTFCHTEPQGILKLHISITARRAMTLIA